LVNCERRMQPSAISDTFKSLLGILIVFIPTPLLNETLDDASQSILQQNKPRHPALADGTGKNADEHGLFYWKIAQIAFFRVRPPPIFLYCQMSGKQISEH
jgi:hypothetical protein